eukprot:Seg987.5 transcript_id=Seg987.5/GoldUCD/mRNA.D3Y31 product="hypothetical protein" protein_id=Seg987.5/GoldUCD/D3Y31
MKAFTRFISRRSKPLQMFSDCGTNFVGADRELQDIMNKWTEDPKLHNRLTDENIKWIYNPPAAPHMGGVWESLIKLAKRAMIATTKGAELTDEELITVLTECEAMLNNRPVTYISNDPNDIEPLIPAHFLNNKCTTFILQHDLGIQHKSLKKRWLHCQNVVNQIWQRWQKEYLPTLQQRSKWNKKKRNIQQDDVVLVMDANQPRGHWLLGRIVGVNSDDNGIVRSAEVKTIHGIHRRPITKLILLVPHNEKTR